MRLAGIRSTASLLAEETALFKKEYRKYFSSEESKPSNIGIPRILLSNGSGTGVLLVHGLMAAPEEVMEWAYFLHAKGLTVYMPRLSGHGTSSSDLSRRKYDDWLDSVDRGLAVLRSCSKRVVIAGFSTGAGLALQTAIMKPRDFDAIISVSAPLKFKSFSSNFAEMLNLFNRFCNFSGLGRLSMEFVRNHADNPHINYHRCPVRSLVQVKKLMGKVRRSLPSIMIPALVIQADKDPKVAPESGPEIFRLLGSANKRFFWVEHDKHGIVRGSIGAEVFKKTEEFLISCGFI